MPLLLEIKLNGSGRKLIATDINNSTCYVNHAATVLYDTQNSFKSQLERHRFCIEIFTRPFLRVTVSYPFSGPYNGVFFFCLSSVKSINIFAINMFNLVYVIGKWRFLLRSSCSPLAPLLDSNQNQFLLSIDIM